MKAKIIRTEADHAVALRRIAALMEHDPEPTSAAGEELSVLALLVGRYEDAVYPMDLPDPVSAIKFRMEQQRLKAKDRIPYIGSAPKVSEVLSGQRELSKAMIRNLMSGLRIPAEVLLQESAAKFSASMRHRSLARMS